MPFCLLLYNDSTTNNSIGTTKQMPWNHSKTFVDDTNKYVKRSLYSYFDLFRYAVMGIGIYAACSFAFGGDLTGLGYCGDLAV